MTLRWRNWPLSVQKLVFKTHQIVPLCSFERKCAVITLRPKIVSYIADDGYEFHCRRWDVDHAVGDIVMLHGIISHSGWYLKTGSHLAGAGFNVHSLDRRGSGLNIQDRGDVSICRRWIDDVVQYIQSLRSQRIILVGISWGGLLATAVAKQMGNEVTGLALLCPGFYSRKGTSSVQHRVVKLATASGLGNIHFPVPLRDPQLFTRSLSWQAYIRDDPFTLRRVTLRLATASAQLYHDTVKAPASIPVPTLLMLGGQDAIIHNDHVKNFVNRYCSDEPTITEYPHSAHTLEFEDDTSLYLNDLTAWCQKAAIRHRPQPSQQHRELRQSRNTK